MTIKTFYKKLREITTQNNLRWRVNRYGAIRCTFKGKDCCPLTAVFNTNPKNKKWIRIRDIYPEDFGMEYKTGEYITVCADNVNSNPTRNALLRNCGLLTSF